MARIILKSPYYKPNASMNLSGYLRYIATREGVEYPEDSKRFLDSTAKQRNIIENLLRRYPDSREFYEYEDYLKTPNRKNADEFIMHTAEIYGELFDTRQKYISYIATRPRTEMLADNGLFSDDEKTIVLADAMREIKNHTGNIWTHIISLRREDAERLGYSSVNEWMTLLRSQRNMIAKEMRISPENFRWYAAFHNESHHPHVHMIAFSADPQEPYLSVEGIQNIKSNLAREIFRQDIISIYEKQTEQRNLLRSDTAIMVANIVDSINHGTYDNPQLEELLLKLSERLRNTNGRKVYGYLKADVKAIVNSIVDELQKDKRIQKLYDLWYEQRFEVLRTYRDTMPKKVPLSENKDFKELKNAVIREAMNLVTDAMTFDDDSIGDEIPSPDISDAESEDTPEPPSPPGECEYERLLLKKHKNKWDFYHLAKYCLDKDSVHFDTQEAVKWLVESAHQGLDIAEYRLGKMFLCGDGVTKDVPYALGWLEAAVAHGNQYAEYLLGKEYIKGDDLPKDIDTAISLLEKSAGQGNKYAQYTLGMLYLKGEDTPKDLDKAMELLTASADRGFEAAEYVAGKLLVSVNIGQALAYLTQAADKGNQFAQYLLGKIYLSGEDIPKNAEIAIGYLENSAEQNNQWSQYVLGKVYLYGHGAELDTERAIALLTASAVQGNPYAASVLNNYADHKKSSVGVGVIQLLSYISRIFQDRLHDEHKFNAIDKKQRRQINEKKEAKGLRYE